MKLLALAIVIIVFFYSMALIAVDVMDITWRDLDEESNKSMEKKSEKSSIE